MATPSVLPRRQRPLSARRLRWLCCREPAELTSTERMLEAALYQRCPELLTMQQHLTAFMALVRQHDRLALDSWLLEAEKACLLDLLGFAEAPSARLCRGSRGAGICVEESASSKDR
jgi:hypothetical protein